MKQYRLVDNIFGWVAFVIAAFVYCSTIEPTASFWDCPEFITTAYKQEIGHPPGAPFFMLLGNFFTHFASDATQVAKMVNTMSALLSAVCILFLFWTITHLARKLIISDWKEMTTSKLIAIEASGMVGALIYTFSDTFWFSAVEGEVYAFSSAFTAVVFWLILKWEDHADEPHSDRWLVLIAYMTGLSIGVHLLNLLCIPAIVLVYYYKKVPHANLKGSLLALILSFAVVVAVLYGVVPGIITVGGWFELFFVNVLGCPFNTGEIVYIICLVAAVIWGIYETYNATDKNVKRQNIAFILGFGMLGIPFYGYGWSAVICGVIVMAILWFILGYKRKQEVTTGVDETTGITKKKMQLLPLVSARIKNTALLCMLMLMIGYSSYALIVIRSSANPPMDQNSPEDIFTLGSYLSRDQYGDRPLFYGQAYTSQVALQVEGDMCKPEMKEGAPVYQRKEKATADEKDSYFIVSHKNKYQYAQNMFFPRMYDAAHAQAYEDWMGGVDGTEVPYDRCGENIMVKVPSQVDNIRFFLSYQCNFMYWRYFMWNFAGRQNDIQGNGEPEHGNWITGFSFIDDSLYGDQSKLPDDLKNNKGHNVFYCMPLILGLIGLFWQAWYTRKRKVIKNGKEVEESLPIGIQQFWVVFFLFFMTGLAIVIYLNQTPMQPRERDYAYAGSFYAYAIWCGLGVLAIINLLKEKAKLSGTAISAIVAVITLLVPIQMASQTWDDHDRSNRYTCRDFGQNYLMSLQEKGNPIIFTNGDNDTFPLWYNQEVEGVGTDARVCNLSYLQTDWYIDQMKRPAYNSPSVPITWPRLDFCSGTNEYVTVEPGAKQQILEFYKQNPEAAKKQFGDEPFELKNVLKYWVRSKNPDLHIIPTDTLYVTIDKEAVKKSGMMMASDTIPDKMVISLAGKTALYKGDLMMLEMIAQCNWVRPIYVALTVGEENYMNLGDNFVQEGLVNRITPFTTNKPGAKNFDTEKAYHNIMTRFKFGNLKQKGLYIDETTMRMCYTHRRLLAQTALQLLSEHKNKKAIDILKKADVEIPDYNVPIDYMSGGLDMARGWILAGQKQKAAEYVGKVWKTASQYLSYYLSLDANRFAQAQNDCIRQIMIMQSTCEVASMVDQKTAKKYEDQLNKLYTLYHGRGGQMPNAGN
ncbi:glycosyltransferase family 117 protein [Segatella hominis]|uniref:glycosyltransferase family 117 protein n=1 Tax=Segatella hominis TaxID=2518605 RepID=UPI003F7E9DE7